MQTANIYGWHTTEVKPDVNLINITLFRTFKGIGKKYVGS